MLPANLALVQYGNNVSYERVFGVVLDSIIEVQAEIKQTGVSVLNISPICRVIHAYWCVAP